ncbi:hypothetical protein M1O16_04575 [Dehalococcoidia bacterium]|nr:hypothetical protein [Dehalococcoidia bacterium]
MGVHDWILIGLTGVLAILTVALLVFSAQSARSSERLKEAIERLREIQENVRDIGLEEIGFKTRRWARIPTAWLAEDFEIVENNLNNLKSEFLPDIGEVLIQWTRHENELAINFRSDVLPRVLSVLKKNAREPELISKAFASGPVNRLFIESQQSQEAENA